MCICQTNTLTALCSVAVATLPLLPLLCKWLFLPDFLIKAEPSRHLTDVTELETLEPVSGSNASCYANSFLDHRRDIFRQHGILVGFLDTVRMRFSLLNLNSQNSAIDLKMEHHKRKIPDPRVVTVEPREITLLLHVVPLLNLYPVLGIEHLEGQIAKDGGFAGGLEAVLDFLVDRDGADFTLDGLDVRWLASGNAALVGRTTEFAVDGDSEVGGGVEDRQGLEAQLTGDHCQARYAVGGGISDVAAGAARESDGVDAIANLSGEIEESKAVAVFVAVFVAV